MVVVLLIHSFKVRKNQICLTFSSLFNNRNRLKCQQQFPVHSPHSKRLQFRPSLKLRSPQMTDPIIREVIVKAVLKKNLYSFCYSLYGRCGGQ